MRRIGWFILLWFVGVGSLALVAAAIRLAIA
jgi:hypothetical protein